MEQAPKTDRREAQTDYIREAIKEDLRSGRFDRVHTRQRLRALHSHQRPGEPRQRDVQPQHRPRRHLERAGAA